MIPIYIQSDSNIDLFWDEIKKSCPHLTGWGLKLLRSGLQDDLKSVLIESKYVCKDHRNLYSNFYYKKFQKVDSLTFRIHFFNKPWDNFESFLSANDNERNDAYIGFSVIRGNHSRCLGRTVFDPLKIKSIRDIDPFILRTKFSANLCGVKLIVNGFPYMSQDADITVCAHSALWGICRFLSEKFKIYKEVYPFDLVQGASKEGGRAYPYRGMTYYDYSSILTEFGTFPLVIKMGRDEKLKKISSEKFKELYTYIESGFPVIASYNGHVVSIIGHTFEKTKNPVPDKNGFIDSSEFTKDLIVVDDNHMPYKLLNRVKNASYAYVIDDLYAAVVPLPEKVFLPAEKIRKFIDTYINKPEIKKRILKTGTGPFVTRLFLTTSISFQRRKRDFLLNTPKDDPSMFFMTLHIPHFIWVLEISPIELYRNLKATVEIILDPTALAADSTVGETLILAQRFGNELHIKGNAKPYPNATNEFPIYTHNLGERNI